MKLSLPQPYEEVPHTADLCVAVRGRTAEEALGRLVLALSSLLAGDAAVAPRDTQRLVVTGGADLAQTAVAVLREVLFRFATGRVVPASVEVLSLRDGRCELEVELGSAELAREAGGTDVKAVTYHAARLAPDGDGWAAQVVLDV